MASRLSLLVCALFTLFRAGAQTPHLLFDLPYTVENGWYVVVLDTPAGPRRFIFDTGWSVTAIGESLRGELGLGTEKRTTFHDFEGHGAEVDRVRLDSIGLGPLVRRDVPVWVLPDSTLVLRCAGVSGIAGPDLLRGLAIRMPNADSTITIAGDIRLLGRPDPKRSVRMLRGIVTPVIPVRFADGDRKMWAWALFDTGSAGYFSYCTGFRRDIFGAGIARDVCRTEGFASNFGWTNRVARCSMAVGRIPALTLAGTVIEDMPFKTTAGHTHVLGTDLLRWGQVVIDFRKRRFWFVPAEDAEPKYERQGMDGVAPALQNGRLVVGQVWDETLRGAIEPGDRVVRLGTIPVDTVDTCAFLRGEIRADRREITVERKDGTRITVPLKKL